MTVLCGFVLYSCFNYRELTSVKSTRGDLCKCISCSGLGAAGGVRKLSGIHCIGEEAQVLHRFSVSWINHLFSLSPHSSYVACQFVKHTASREVLSSIYLDWMIWSRDLFHCVSWKHSWNSRLYPANQQTVTIQCSKRMALQQVTEHCWIKDGSFPRAIFVR